MRSSLLLPSPIVAIRGSSSSRNFHDGGSYRCRWLVSRQQLFRDHPPQSPIAGSKISRLIHLMTLQDPKRFGIRSNGPILQSPPLAAAAAGFPIGSKSGARQIAIRNSSGSLARTDFQRSALRSFASTTTTTSTSTATVLLPLVEVSSVTETPLDSDVMEKPYTVVLMEDNTTQIVESKPQQQQEEEKEQHSTEEFSWKSWIETFRSQIPRDYGMSFVSVSLHMVQHAANNNNNNHCTSIKDTVNTLKESTLPTLSDAVLVARGPVSSLVAQYYLESCSLKGVVLVDPLLVDRDELGQLFGEMEVSSNETHKEQHPTRVMLQKLFPKDTDSQERFAMQRLLLEPNAVPTIVVRTIDDDEPSWIRQGVERVAEKHGDPEGPYGMVPIVDIGTSSDNNNNKQDRIAKELLQRIDEWIEEGLEQYR